jgi:hypothetical protein
MKFSIFSVSKFQSLRSKKCNVKINRYVQETFFGNHFPFRIDINDRFLCNTKKSQAQVQRTKGDQNADGKYVISYRGILKSAYSSSIFELV